jgi:hypothetical protein
MSRNLVAVYDEDTYRFTTDDSTVIVELARIRATRTGDIKAEIEVRWNQAPLAGLLHHGTINLLAERSVKQLANQLSDRISEHDWYGTLLAITYLAKKRYREGEPPIALDLVDPKELPRWLIKPIIEHGGPTVLAAPGGSAKSMLALALAATVATGRTRFLGLRPMRTGAVLYLDWEADQYAHSNRLGAMCAAAEVEKPTTLFYRREYAPLHESVDELAKHVRELKAELVVVDSKGAALAGAPEDAEGTLRFFRAIRRLAVPTLVVDHVTNEAAHGKGAKRPFGSVYTQNMARNIWMAERASGEPGETVVLCKHTKSNNGPIGTKLAWRMEFVTDDDLYETIRCQPVNPIEVAVMPTDDSMSLRDKIARILETDGKPMTVVDLATLTGAGQSAVRARLNEGKMDGSFVNVSQGPTGKWMLTSEYIAKRLGDSE